jgi:membrane protein implicated in regulation of membrane protease activity
MDIFYGSSLITLFAVIGGLGFAFLIVSLVVGDVFEAVGMDLASIDGHTDFGFLDSRVLAVFITAFGGFGLIAAVYGLGPLASSFAGLIGGVIFGGVVSAFGRFLVGQQASSSVSDADLIGRRVQVTVAIKPGVVGQITATIGDERVEKLARSSDGREIAAGSIVMVDAIAGDSLIVSSD